MSVGLQQFDLTGRVAIVTGGSKGLGRSMAEGLASAGANIAVTSRNLSDASQVADELRKAFSIQAVGLEVDVRDSDSVEQMVTTTTDKLGGIDILINNAGINIRGPIEELSFEQFREVQATNVDGVWLCARAVVPVMKRAGHGRIINMGSTLSSVGLEDRTPYAASKGAVAQLTRALALELAPLNILVNAICPGPFLTEMNVPIADSEHAKKHIIGATALGRWGALEEIQGAAIFLASDAARYMTGSMVTVDGGWTAR